MTLDPDPVPSAVPLTELLGRALSGESLAEEAVLPLVYRELRQIARARMAGERADHTLQATALVNETWLKLVGMRDTRWRDRTAFYQAAATAMRRILVDHARRRRRQKRGGESRRESVSLANLAEQTPDVHSADILLQLDEAIIRLEQEDPRAGAIVRLRFYAGLDVDATAAALRLSPRTVAREWAWIRATLYLSLTKGKADP
jgi:RNA polymerase sigma factor (TIGR02999 family)